MIPNLYMGNGVKVVSSSSYEGVKVDMSTHSVYHHTVDELYAKSISENLK